MAFCWERTPDAAVRSLHLLCTKSLERAGVGGEGRSEIVKMICWKISRGNRDYNRDLPLHCVLVIPCLPKQPGHPPEGQGCGVRAEGHLEGAVVGRTSAAEHDGVGQELEEQETEACQGEPEEHETEVIQLFLHSAVCRNREKEGPPSVHSWCYSQLWWGQGSCPGPCLVCLRQSFPWACIDVLLLSAFSWELERGHVAKIL